jgi:hypothetical protein
MAVSHHPGALLASSYALPRGPRVTLRLVRGRDLSGIRGLARRAGADLDELALVRLVNFDLSAQIVMCATALVGTSETVVGVGAIELDAPNPAPSRLIVDEELTDGLAGLLTGALTGHAAALARARVA